MRQIISFDRVKLTNNEMDDKGHVSVHNPLSQGEEEDAKASAGGSPWKGQEGVPQIY